MPISISVSTEDRSTIFIHDVTDEQLALLGKSKKDITEGFESINIDIGNVSMFLFPKEVIQ